MEKKIKPAFTMKQYEDALNGLDKLIVKSNGINVIPYYRDDGPPGTRYRRNYPVLFREEYLSVVNDSDMYFFVFGRYPDDNSSDDY